MAIAGVRAGLGRNLDLGLLFWRLPGRELMESGCSQLSTTHPIKANAMCAYRSLTWLISSGSYRTSLAMRFVTEMEPTCKPAASIWMPHLGTVPSLP